MSGPAGRLWVLKLTDDRRPGCNTLTRGSRRGAGTSSCCSSSAARRCGSRRLRATSRCRPRIAGSCAGGQRRRPSARRSPACWIARAGRITAPGCFLPFCRIASWHCAPKRAGGRGCSPVSSASPIRRSGACCIATAARAHHEQPGRPLTGMSGRARETCCTWTPPATRASHGPVMRAQATAPARSRLDAA
jgi:hypothetical protein